NSCRWVRRELSDRLQDLGRQSRFVIGSQRIVAMRVVPRADQLLTRAPTQRCWSVVSEPASPHVNVSFASNVEKSAENRPVSVPPLNTQLDNAEPPVVDEAVKSWPLRTPENEARSLDPLAMSCSNRIEPAPTVMRHGTFVRVCPVVAGRTQ